MNRKPSVKVSVSGLEMVHPCIRSENFSTRLGPSTRTPQISCGVRISKGKLRLGFQTQLLGNLTGGRIAQERTVRKRTMGNDETSSSVRPKDSSQRATRHQAGAKVPDW